MAVILVGQQDVVPGSLGLFSRVGSSDRSGVRVTFLHQAICYEVAQKGIEFFFNFGLQAVDVKVLSIGMAAGAGSYGWRKGVGTALTKVAAHAGILDHRVVRTGGAFSFGASAADTHYNRDLWAVVRAIVRAGDIDIAFSGFLNGAARLVAGGAQVARATVKGHVESVQSNRFSLDRQSPVISRVGGVDLVAGAAVDGGNIYCSYSRRGSNPQQPWWGRKHRSDILYIHHGHRHTTSLYRQCAGAYPGQQLWQKYYEMHRDIRCRQIRSP